MLARIFLASRDCLISSFTCASNDTGKGGLQSRNSQSVRNKWDNERDLLLLGNVDIKYSI